MPTLPTSQTELRGVKKLSGGDSVDLGNLGISQLSLDKRNLSLASEKDLKTCANIDTKFQQVLLTAQSIPSSFTSKHNQDIFRSKRNGAGEV